MYWVNTCCVSFSGGVGIDQSDYSPIVNIVN